LKVTIKPYEAIFAALHAYSESFSPSPSSANKCKVLIGTQASWALSRAIGEDNLEIVPSPVADAKAIKNKVEIEGFRQCHIRDGAALSAYLAWLEEELGKGAKISEAEAADKLEQYRSRLDLFKGLSFTTISSTGPNGAIIHYSPDREDCAIIDKDQLYLVDSGGQYLDGTTDVTRTLHFGNPSEEEIRAFTLVLKGHIAIDKALFPQGTTGFKLDILARAALWRDGLDFNHGTGHGVGSYLAVHEGPQSIAAREISNKAALKAGMTVSDEPGYYKDGHWGIRIENVVVVQDVKLANDFGKRGWLGFEHVTMTPIQTKLVDVALLSQDEKDWLNAYHEEVYAKVSPLLKQDERASKWLERECKAI